MTTPSPQDGPLVHVGYHKTASTWLQRRIFSDESLGYLEVRPRTIIDQAFIVCNPFRFDPADAAEFFADWEKNAADKGSTLVISHERLSGQPQMGYIDSRPIADRIAATYPNAKILIVIREQRDMMLSVYKQHIMRFGKNTFDHMWRERTIREQRRPGPTYDMFEYHLMIGYYQKLFGADRVLVLPFEMLKQDAVAFVGEIQKFAGLPAPTEVPSSRDNVALAAAAVSIVRYVNILFRMVGIGTVFAGPIADKRSRRIRLGIIRALGPRLPKRWSRRIEDRWRDTALTIAAGRFAASNRIVEEITGLRLGRYGYDLPAGVAAPADVGVDQGGR
jgi:sulfotransferase family protein